MESSVNDGFEYQCNVVFRSACQGLDFYGEIEGKQYCVLHFPGQSKEVDGSFQEAVEKKIKSQDLNFSGVYFPSTNFEASEFESEVDFTWATFVGEASFYGANFRKQVVFFEVTFCGGAGFFGATFSGDANISGAVFRKKAVFYEATPKERAAFSNAVFREEANFSKAIINGEAD